MDIDNKIAKLRALMKEKSINAYIIPSTDSHQSEYIPDYFKSREWISGFTGSAGTVLVTEKSAILWTDGRYFLQAEAELKGKKIELFKMGEQNVPSINEYLKKYLEKSQTVGFDGKLFSQQQVIMMKKAFKGLDIRINVSEDLIDEIWDDRPPLPKGKAFIHETKYSGQSTGEKLDKIRKEMKEKSADYYLMSSLDDIAWTFNIRGVDIKYNPVVISYALVELEKATLFVDSEKLDENSREILLQENIVIKNYIEIEDFLKTLNVDKNIYFDLDKTSVYCYENIPKKMKHINGKDIVASLKAIKNKTEIENFKRCQLRDGVAMVKFLHWLDTNVGKIEISELSASEKLEEIRSEGENYVSLSFETIAGYKDHAAIVHYSVDQASNYSLKAEGMLLLDSGAQYLDGTTDITRTIVLGDITDEEKRDFTLVLKGHISLSQARFLYGTTGTQLDVLARKPLWEEGKDYKHGTGHGVGYLLNVHEGPHGISPKTSTVRLESGMFVTNEPGFYKNGEYGIRTENILLLVDDVETEFGRWMKFETTTLCPMDLRGVEIEILSDGERDWLNDYHKEVREKISPFLDDEEKEWLEINTREI